MDVQLTFINESDAGARTSVVLYQKNNALSSVKDERPVAWRVLPISSRGTQQKLHVSQRLSVAAMDAMGCVCEQHLSEYQQHWDVVSTKTRDWMILDNTSIEPNRIAIRNSLTRAVVTAQIYKDGRLLAEQPGINPKETALFHFDNTIWMAITSEPVNEGDVIPSENSLKFVTELPLDDFTKADLILTNTGDEYRFRLLPVAHEHVLVHK